MWALGGKAWLGLVAAVACVVEPVCAEAGDGPRDEVRRLAFRAYECGRESFTKPFLTVVDYSLPSTQRRLWVLDVRTGEVVLEELVAHGKNSGGNRVSTLSNVLGSKQSSLGLFRTDETYVGKHGYSLRLSGLEEGWNDRARERAIVIHGADYVGPEIAAGYGRLGRSWGCPAVRPAVTRRLIDRIKNGGALFVYYPDEDWLGTSEFLNCQGRLALRGVPPAKRAVDRERAG